MAIILRIMAWNIYEGVGGPRVIDWNLPACRDNWEREDCPKAAAGMWANENEALPNLATIIKENTPDIVLLNEIMIWHAGVHQVRELMRLTGLPHAHWVTANTLGAEGLKLVAVLSRYPLDPPLRRPVMDGNVDPHDYCALQTSFPADGRLHVVFSLRFDAGNRTHNVYGHQQAVQWVQSVPSNAAVIMGGDFNAPPLRFDPNATPQQVTARMYERINGFLFFSQSSGLTNCVVVPTDQNEPIDHIFFRGPYIIRSSRFEEPRLPCSDHGFVFAELITPGPFFAKYGDTVKLKHWATGRILHSHLFNYGHPGSSGQQQVTAFESADDNDDWIVLPGYGKRKAKQITGQSVRSGAVIRLQHRVTGRNLHSHNNHASPVTAQQEVTAFEQSGVVDAKDYWRIEIEGGGVWDAGKRVRLIHVITGAALHSHDAFSDPQWTMGQQEVTGFQGRDDNDWWYLFACR